ncbi:UvrD-helicase domain-containing protein [Fibrella sp. WM1]|uniref:UvrD-helicase domain-containing protein n=1 Tax=Fibrella musci TaxID=3242485 RepID=UPI003522600C
MFKIYSASAGSGKTYTLTKEYLKLALGEGLPLADTTYRGTYFRHILAITFTNAAANEMKDRILRELAQIAQLDLIDVGDIAAIQSRKDTPFLLVLAAELADVPDTSLLTVAQVVEVQRRAKRLFQAILHRYSDFSVTTIDAFTQRLVMAFTDELGLPYSFEVEMETELVLEVAVDNLIERVGTDEMDDISAILHQIYAETARDGRSWNMIAEALRDFGNVLTSDQHYEAIGRIAELTPAQLRTIRQQLLQFGADVKGRIQDAGQRAWSAITRAGLGVDDFAQKSKGIGAFFKAVAEGDVDKEPNSYHRAAIDDGNWMGKKPLPGTLAVIEGIANELCACFALIEQERTANGKLLTLFRAIDPHLQKMALLQQIRAEFVELLRKDNRVHISEFNKRIKAIVESEPVPFLFEKLGSRYNHILIDEFQDTSQLQFANLLPLIENALGSNYFNLAVGDGKQAIYRWRGGDMDQIVALHRNQLTDLQRIHGPDTWTAERIDTLGGHIQPQLLDTNWRSARPIVQFNNDFFDFVARRYAADNRRIDEVYDELKAFQQKPSPRAADTAHLQLNFLSADDAPLAGLGSQAGRSLADEVVKQTVAHIRQARADGYDYGDMAVLTRSRKNAQLVANELNRLNIPLVSADSLSLQFSEPVRFLVSLLTMLSRPGQKTLHYEVLYLYHSVVHNRVPNDEQTEELRRVADTTEDWPTFDYLAREGYALDAPLLVQLSVYELAEKLTHGFRLFDRTHDQPFLFRFLDEILTFCGRQSGHLADFLLHWEAVKGKVSVSEGLTRNAVTIQTIHKSKGLEYPVVIVPFADWTVEPSARDTIWVDLDGIDAAPLHVQLPDGGTARLPNAQVTLKKELDGAPQEVAAQYAEEKSRAFIENMNLLYVAFTRPTDRLYIIAENKKFSDARAQATAAYWLHSFLRDSDVAQQAGCCWEEGRQQYILCQDVSTPKPSKHVPDTATERIDFRAVNSGSRAQNLQLRRLAERVFDTRTFEQHRERDRKLCAALSLIKGIDCIDKTLARLIREGVIRAAELPDLRDGLTAIVAHPDLTDAFGYDRRIDTDRSILTRNLAKEVLKGAPHRVVHRPDGHIVLIQYESVVGPSESHLETFIELYRQMGYPRVEGRIVWLANEPTVERISASVTQGSSPA